MTAPSPAIDVAHAIDTAPLSPLQIRVFLICGTLAILDGYDHLVIGYAAPSMIRQLGVGAEAMGPVFASVLLGSAIGGLLLAPMADRVGRKPMMIVSILIFALFSGLTGLVRSLPELLAFRLLAGVGLGGATPCLIALASEFAPTRLRGVITTLLWASYPIGGIIGGFASAVVLPRWDWPALFYIGGVLPLLGTVSALFALPESPRFLARIKGRRAELDATITRITGVPVPPDAAIVTVGASEGESRGNVAALFRDGRAALTALLWLGFFFAFILAVLVPLWAPTLLQANGLSIARTSVMVGLFNFGALAGMCILGYLLDRFGPSRVLSTIFVISALTIAPVGLVLDQPFLSAALFTVSGLGAGGGAAGMVALATVVYPTSLRSTGIGWGVAMGRFGQMFGPIAGGALVGMGWMGGPIFAVFSIPALIAAVVTGYFGHRAHGRRPHSISTSMMGS